MYVVNSFSVSMLPVDCDFAKVSFTKITLEAARRLLRSRSYTSAVNHKDTAVHFSNLLDGDIGFHRTSVVLKECDDILLGQYKGPRLDEDVSLLPEGSVFDWYHITFTTSLI